MAKKAKHVKNNKKTEEARMSSHQISTITRHPFPREWRSRITWTPSTAFLSPGATSGAFVVALNDLYDPDYSNLLGNNQPLFTDQILSATGPYQRFRVESWKTKITLVNVSPVTAGGSYMPLDVCIMQGATNAVDVDTYSELVASPGIETEMLGPATTTLGQMDWYYNGRLLDYIPNATSVDESYCGYYNASPSNRIFMGVGYKNGDPADATSIKLFAKVKIEFEVVFFARDAVVS